ncbi:MAG TPA: helix-hairpin-helix domain-containing protein [Gemmatimonadaceae bacterium]|nr:helix-hairpin-helix domain-containing protein [Gemmatimonadaceae bacterium]
MTMRADHKALLFIGAVGVLGAGVRVVRASTASDHGDQPALAHQMQAADSSAHAQRGPRPKSKGRRGGAKSPADSTPAHAAPTHGAGALDRPGYINGKLDLDAASAAQIDSLPGVSTLMAKRIAVDRMLRGPFVNRDGLRRVSGAGPTFVARIDSLVTFSGTVLQPSPTDTIIPARSSKRAAPRPQAPKPP